MPHSYTPSVGESETGRSLELNGQSLQHSWQAPASVRDLVSNKAVSFWETIPKVVLWPPQACTHMHQSEHAHPRMSSPAKVITSLAPFQSCRLLASYIKADEFVLCPSSRKYPSVARLQRDRISDSDWVCSCLSVQLGPQAQSCCFWKQGPLACSSSGTLALIHKDCPRLGMSVSFIHLLWGQVSWVDHGQLSSGLGSLCSHLKLVPYRLKSSLNI